MDSTFPLPVASLSEAPLNFPVLRQLEDLIQDHLAQGRYPGCQVALAYQGRLLMDHGFGFARQGERPVAAASDTLWVLYSNTKILIATTLWKLMETGRLRFADKVSDYLPAFGAHGKSDISLFQVITHQGGFPNAEVPEALWLDHDKVLDAVAEFQLEWTPGSRVHYHSLSAHWVLAMVIEAITGQDYRQVVTELVLQPLGLSQDLYMGLPDELLPDRSTRMAYLYEPDQTPRMESSSRLWQQAGVPGAGAYGTARGMVALYQMMLQGGTLNGVRLLSPRTLAYAIRNYTGERVDEFMGLPMHRGLGPHLRGHSIAIRGLGSIAPPNAYGHGGVGTSYCWADPNSGISFAYLSNARLTDPWHSMRLDQISNAVHAAIQMV